MSRASTPRTVSKRTTLPRIERVYTGHWRYVQFIRFLRWIGATDTAYALFSKIKPGTKKCDVYMNGELDGFESISPNDLRLYMKRRTPKVEDILDPPPVPRSTIETDPTP